MTIRNETELADLALSRIPNNTSNEVSPTDIRTQLQDERDSLMPNGCVIRNQTPIASIAVSATPQVITASETVTSETDIWIPQPANNRIICKEPVLGLYTVRFQGSWPLNEDLNFALFLNNVQFGGGIAQEGQGAGDPIPISFARLGIVVNSAAIAADPAGQGGAVIDFRMWSTTGGFNVDQDSMELGIEYSQGSIRTVG